MSGFDWAIEPCGAYYVDMERARSASVAAIVEQAKRLLESRGASDVWTTYYLVAVRRGAHEWEAIKIANEQTGGHYGL